MQKFMRRQHALAVFFLIGLLTLSSVTGVFITAATHASAADGQYDWVERTVDTDANGWMYIAGSADGNKLAVADYYGYIYTSINGGETWVKRESAGLRSWYSIASSADGTKLAAVEVGGYIYTSSDSGATWTERTSSGTRSWVDIASSADGTKLAATVNTGSNSHIYTSSDSGATWTERTSAGDRRWSYISSSSDGTKLATIGFDSSGTIGYIYTSTDSGVTWTERTAAGSKTWNSIAMSADGNKMAAGVSSGYIYTSVDSGSTWTERTSAGTGGWYSVAISADGTKFAALHHPVASPYSIYTSDDDGVTWTEQNIADAADWSVMTISADGAKIAAASYDPPLFTGSIDLDTDPVSDAVESAAPNNGDGNYDGIADARQANVASFVNPVTNKYVTLVATGLGGDVCNFTSAVVKPASENETSDTAYAYPFGFVDFITQCDNVGASAHIEVYMHGASAAGYVARKYNATIKQYSNVSSAAFTTSNNALVLSYDITDGGNLDEDGTADGNITDPIGIGSTVSQVLPPNTGLHRISPALLVTAGIVGIGALIGVGFISLKSRHS